jgi:probable rRNA maturation factor
MIVSIDIDDAAWLAIDDLENKATQAAEHCAQRTDFGTEPVAVTILLTDDDAVAELNRTWRGKSGPTNVLSFPAGNTHPNPDDAVRHLGDIALAFGVVAREAEEQGKALDAHMTHLLVHGLLHLAGFDHMNEAEAEIMETREIAILKGLGIADPYHGEVLR